MSGRLARTHNDGLANGERIGNVGAHSARAYLHSLLLRHNGDHRRRGMSCARADHDRVAERLSYGLVYSLGYGHGHGRTDDPRTDSNLDAHGLRYSGSDHARIARRIA